MSRVADLTGSMCDGCIRVQNIFSQTGFSCRLRTNRYCGETGPNFAKRMMVDVTGFKGVDVHEEWPFDFNPQTVLACPNKHMA